MLLFKTIQTALFVYIESYERKKAINGYLPFYRLN